MERGYMNKRGLDAVVTTLIIILLVLVAVGIIWVVVRNVVQQGSDQIDINSKCLAVDIRATAATCTAAGVCNVTYRRNAGGEAIDGVVVVLGNGLTTNQSQVAGNVAPLDTRTLTNFATGMTSPVPNTAEVTPYFVDSSGNQKICAPTGSFEF